MKKLKVAGAILLGIAVAVAGAGVYLKTALPNVGPAPAITIVRTPERISRGKYLAHHVAVCMDCHSTRDWSLPSGPIVPGTLGGGGERFSKEMGFPGEFYASNITPAALGSWSDGEILRAIASGVNKTGRALLPVMAYHRFGAMDREDLYDIIAYLRTLPPINKAVPESKAEFPVNFLINTMPKAAAFTEKPRRTEHLAYGRYLVNVAGCVDCHSKRNKGALVPGTEFGGGMEFRQAGGTLVSPNITFDTKTGIGLWTREMFVGRFRRYADSSYHPARLAPGDLNTPMPWSMYAGMSSEDLGAIYDYLKQLKPMSGAKSAPERQ